MSFVAHRKAKSTAMLIHPLQERAGLKKTTGQLDVQALDVIISSRERIPVQESQRIVDAVKCI